MGQEESKISNNDQLLYNNQINLTKSMFDFIYVIGKGGFGKVWRVKLKKTQKFYAIKEMSKLKIILHRNEKSILNERELLSKLHHPFIVNMMGAFQDTENLFLILDLYRGGDLRYHLFKNKKFSEEQSRFFCACIITGLEYIHLKNILHRDIKPENLVLDSNGYCSITDFGVAKIYIKENSHETSGTPGYMAPEVLCSQNHSFTVDFYALGVICYEFMTGHRPYLGKSRKEIKEAILSNQVEVNRKDLIENGWSIEAGDFINRLLQRKVVRRLGFNGINEIKSHFWFQKINWGDLYKKKLQCPFLPKNGDNFDKKFCEAPDVNLDEKIFFEKGEYEYFVLKEKCKRVFINYDFVREEEKKHAMLLYNLKKNNDNKIGKSSSYIKVTLNDRTNNISKMKPKLNFNYNGKNKNLNLDLFSSPSNNNIGYNSEKAINTERLNSKNFNTINVAKKKLQQNNFLKSNNVFCKKIIQKNINEINVNNNICLNNSNKNLDLSKINSYIDENVNNNNFLLTNRNMKNNSVSMKNLNINNYSNNKMNQQYNSKPTFNRNLSDYVFVGKRKHNNNSMDNVITNYDYKKINNISKKHENKNIYSGLSNKNNNISNYLDNQIVYSPPHFQNKQANLTKNSFINSSKNISTRNANKNLSYNSNLYFSSQEINTTNNYQNNNANENKYTSLSNYLYKKNNMASTATNFNYKYKKNNARPTCLYSNNQMMRDNIFLNDGSIDSFKDQDNNSIINFANKTLMRFNIKNNNFSKYINMNEKANEKFQLNLYKNNVERKKHKNISSENLRGGNTQRISTYCNNNKENMNNNCNNSISLREYTFRSKNKNKSLTFLQE